MIKIINTKQIDKETFEYEIKINNKLITTFKFNRKY